MEICLQSNQYEVGTGFLNSRMSLSCAESRFHSIAMHARGGVFELSSRLIFMYLAIKCQFSKITMMLLSSSQQAHNQSSG